MNWKPLVIVCTSALTTMGALSVLASGETSSTPNDEVAQTSSEISWDSSTLYFDAFIPTEGCQGIKVAHSAEIVEGRDNVVFSSDITIAECGSRFELPMPELPGVYTVTHSVGSVVDGNFELSSKQRILERSESGEVARLPLSQAPNNIAFDGDQ